MIIHSLDQLEPFFTLLALKRNRVTNDTCFLCAKVMPQGAVSEEHIIPQWVQDDFKLRDSLLTLRNGTRIPYRSAKIPCCKACNNKHLSDLEKFISRNVRSGKKGIKSIPSIAWYLWVGKIRLALIYKDCLIAQDRSNPISPRLGHPDELQMISVIRHALQFIRFQKDVWLHIPDSPDSVLQFHCQDPAESEFRWDIQNLLHPFITAVRMGPVGVIVAFRDESFIAANCNSQLLPYRFIDLHPMQFIEVLARITWIALHQHRFSNYRTTVGIGRFELKTIPAWTDCPSELFKIPDTDLFPIILHTMQNIDAPTAPEGQHHSYLHYDDGKVIYQIDWNQVKARTVGDLLAGRCWIDVDNLPDTPHFGPEHIGFEHHK